MSVPVTLLLPVHTTLKLVNLFLQGPNIVGPTTKKKISWSVNEVFQGLLSREWWTSFGQRIRNSPPLSDKFEFTDNSKQLFYGEPSYYIYLR